MTPDDLSVPKLSPGGRGLRRGVLAPLGPGPPERGQEKDERCPRHRGRAPPPQIPHADWSVPVLGRFPKIWGLLGEILELPGVVLEVLEKILRCLMEV